MPFKAKEADPVKSTRLVVVGLGRIGAELLTRLSRDFEVTCIALNEDAEEVLAGLKRKDVKLIVGDATSRLVLEDAGANEAHAVIITTDIERVNLEVCSLLKQHFSPERVISVALTHKGMDTLEEMGVEVVNLFTAGAMGIRNMLEQRSKTAHAVGIGKDEILEVEVHPNSRLANKPMGIIDPIKWRLGIIYRDGNVIVPRPDTVIRPKDRVIILGDPTVLRTVSEIFTFSFEKFPLEYGSNMMVALTGQEEERFMEEVKYIFSAFPFEKAIVVHPPAEKPERFEAMAEGIGARKLERREAPASVLGALESTLAEYYGEQGLVVVSGAVLGGGVPIVSAARKKAALRSLLRLAKCPFLIARGTFPYESVAVPCLPETEVGNVLETAFEISWALSNEITALEVEPSRYIASEKEAAAFGEIKKTISDMSLMYKAKVQTRVLAGNPIRAILRESADFNLLIFDMASFAGGGWLMSLLNPDVAWSAVRNSRVSTLVIPPVEESL
jgi:Trk K+ transport system NAD-binding subunit